MTAAHVLLPSTKNVCLHWWIRFPLQRKKYSELRATTLNCCIHMSNKMNIMHFPHRRLCPSLEVPDPSSAMVLSISILTEFDYPKMGFSSLLLNGNEFWREGWCYFFSQLEDIATYGWLRRDALAHKSPTDNSWSLLGTNLYPLRFTLFPYCLWYFKALS